jgi:Sec-independent protein secretion pathway components
VAGNLGGWTGLIVVLLIILLFGAPRLPGLAKSLGQSLKIFKSEVRQDRSSDDAADNADDQKK